MRKRLHKRQKKTYREFTKGEYKWPRSIPINQLHLRVRASPAPQGGPMATPLPTNTWEGEAARPGSPTEPGLPTTGRRSRPRSMAVDVRRMADPPVGRIWEKRPSLAAFLGANCPQLGDGYQRCHQCAHPMTYAPTLGSAR